jgi:hypothetical protein
MVSNYSIQNHLSCIIFTIGIYFLPKPVIGIYFFNSPNNQPKVYKIKTEINKPNLQGRRFDRFNSKHSLGNLKEKSYAHEDKQCTPNKLYLYFIFIH